jgi:hypothetical protein
MAHVLNKQSPCVELMENGPVWLESDLVESGNVGTTTLIRDGVCLDACSTHDRRATDLERISFDENTT